MKQSFLFAHLYRTRLAIIVVSFFLFAPFGASAAKFVLNDRVTVQPAILNVRTVANGTIVGTQSAGALGTVISGPVSAGGLSWWNINYDSGVDGWSAENYLEKAPTLYTLTASAPVANATVSGTVTVSGSAPGFLNVEVSSGGVFLARATPGTGGAFTASVNTLQVANGSQTLTINAWNSAPGQPFTKTAQVTRVVNVSNYTLSVSAPAANATVSGTVTVSGTAPGFLNVEVSSGGVFLARATPVAGGAFTMSMNTALIPNGSRTLTINAWNSAPGQPFTKTAQVTRVVNVSNSGQPANSLSITAYGATGNDTTDDTTAINNTIDAAKLQGKSVWIPSGSFRHSGLVILNGLTMTGAGDTSILVATNPDLSAIKLAGVGSVLKSIKTTSPSATTRGSVPAQAGVLIEGASNFLVENVTVTRVRGAGIFNYLSSSNGKIINNRVSDTLADSIHNTSGVHDIIIANNYIRNSGDDMVAVVSYVGQSAPVTNVLIQNNNVAEQTGGRGISVIGGKDITIVGNKVGRTNVAAGIIIATESSYNTMSVSNILVRNNQLSYNSGTTGHGSLFVSGRHLTSTIDRVRFEGNTVTFPTNDSIKIEGNPTNTALINNIMSDPEGRGINLPGGTNTYCSGNTLNGAAATNAKCTSSLNFTVTGSTLTF